MAEKENQSIHRIAILSDTHGLLRPEIKEVLKTCEVILHGGDISSQKILDVLKEIALVYVVRGNNDKEWAEYLDKELVFTLFGLRIYMVHNKKHRKSDLSETDLFIYGHSHKYEEKIVDGVHFLNPGSCGPRRFRQPVTMAVLEVDEETKNWQIQKIDLTESGENKDDRPLQGINEGNLKSTVETIIREMRAGRKVEQIAKKLGVDNEFVEQVCRIYVTHPGVSAQGIVDKMEVSALFDRK
ncbi:MAG: metallophosphatase family protein [Lachnospiraceae bacterium]|nr:metallophosphatase family protein [Lachnospiraceae bacterium]MDE7202949.1 metallophosphatase family protein [Lachnospiraceae bacterium]